MSGGVDSTVTAYLVQGEGRTVVGASHDVCRSRICNDETLGRAKRFCADHGMPYYRLHLEEPFRERVVDDFIGTYLAGKTPNPCVRCNERIRFTLFYELLASSAREAGLLRPDEPLFFATGHYARVELTTDGYFLRRGLDRSKDQSYMLYRIPKTLLPYLVLPLGAYTKADVVALARERGFPSASVRESQDICFIDGEYTDFMKRSLGPERTAAERVFRPGEICDRSGRVLGRHSGCISYTVGQRKGLGLGDGPWYVTAVDTAANRVVVGRRHELEKNTAVVGELAWFIEPPAELSCTVNLRYQSRDIPCTVSLRPDGTAVVSLSRAALVSPGQSAVFYRDDLVLGGGIILG